jgi:cell division protein ZipA
MPELRWTLLIVGILFVAGLWLWSRRRMPGGSETGLSSSRGSDRPENPTGYAREAITLPELQVPPSERESPRELPVFEMSDLDLNDDSEDASGTRRPRVTLMSEHAVDVPGSRGSRPEARDPLEATADDLEAVAPAQDMPAPDASHPIVLILDWPPENERRFLSVRVVAAAEGQFSGHAVRQALAGEGFWHGKFDIYHLPMPDGRVVISAASLTKPGTFDLATMDGHSYPGLNLFAVLPGPLPESVTLDELVAVARMLAGRLSGQLLDHRGQVLTAQRVAEMRATLSGGAAPTIASGER